MWQGRLWCSPDFSACVTVMLTLWFWLMRGACDTYRMCDTWVPRLQSCGRTAVPGLSRSVRRWERKKSHGWIPLRRFGFRCLAFKKNSYSNRALNGVFILVLTDLVRDASDFTSTFKILSLMKECQSISDLMPFQFYLAFQYPTYACVRPYYFFWGPVVHPWPSIDWTRTVG